MSQVKVKLQKSRSKVDMQSSHNPTATYDYGRNPEVRRVIVMVTVWVSVRNVVVDPKSRIVFLVIRRFGS